MEKSYMENKENKDNQEPMEIEYLGVILEYFVQELEKMEEKFNKITLKRKRKRESNYDHSGRPFKKNK